MQLQSLVLFHTTKQNKKDVTNVQPSILANPHFKIILDCSGERERYRSIRTDFEFRPIQRCLQRLNITRLLMDQNGGARQLLVICPFLPLPLRRNLVFNTTSGWNNNAKS